MITTGHAGLTWAGHQLTMIFRQGTSGTSVCRQRHDSKRKCLLVIEMMMGFDWPPQRAANDSAVFDIAVCMQTCACVCVCVYEAFIKYMQIIVNLYIQFSIYTHL